MISNIYYKIWVDGLLKLRSLPSNKGIWKFYGFIFISMAMALNIALIVGIFQQNFYGKLFYQLEIDRLSGTRLNSLINFFVLYLAPPSLINFLLIFKNKRYEQLFKKYNHYNGKLCIWYLMISYFLPFVLLLLGFFLNKLS
jgi:hypothetical protein